MQKEQAAWAVHRNCNAITNRVPTTSQATPECTASTSKTQESSIDISIQWMTQFPAILRFKVCSVCTSVFTQLHLLCKISGVLLGPPSWWIFSLWRQDGAPLLALAPLHRSSHSNWPPNGHFTSLSVVVGTTRGCTTGRGNSTFTLWSQLHWLLPTHLLLFGWQDFRFVSGDFKRVLREKASRHRKATSTPFLHLLLIMSNLIDNAIAWSVCQDVRRVPMSLWKSCTVRILSL